jgi:hypothetical protein
LDRIKVKNKDRWQLLQTDEQVQNVFKDDGGMQKRETLFVNIFNKNDSKQKQHDTL